MRSCLTLCCLPLRCCSNAPWFMQGTPHTSHIIGAFEDFCPPLSLHSCSSCTLAACFCPLKCICSAPTSLHQISQRSHLGFEAVVALDCLFFCMKLTLALCFRPLRCCCITRALEQLAWQRSQTRFSAAFLILLGGGGGVGGFSGVGFLFRNERGPVGTMVFGGSLRS